MECNRGDAVTFLRFVDYLGGRFNTWVRKRQARHCESVRETSEIVCIEVTISRRLIGGSKLSRRVQLHSAVLRKDFVVTGWPSRY